MVIFNIYHIFAPFVKPCGWQIFVFLQPTWYQERSSLSASRTFQPQGVKQKKTQKIKKNTYCQSLPSEMEQNWIIFTPPPLQFVKKSLTDPFTRDSHMEFMGKIKSAIPHEQNYAAWLVKNGKAVFSKLMCKISLSVSGQQASWQPSARPGVFLSQNFRYFPAF